MNKKGRLDVQLPRLLRWLVAVVFVLPSLGLAQISVSNQAELIAALAVANGGETILLSGGDYGALEIHDRNFGQYVTLRSANKERAKFTNIDIENSAFIRLQDLFFEPGAREGVGVFASSHFELLDSEIQGAMQFDRENPSYTQVGTLYGVYVGDGSQNVLIENNVVNDVVSTAYAFFGVNSLTVRGNYCDWVASDCFKFGGIEELLVENNFGAQQVHSSPTAHVDFMQGQGDINNALFIGNVALMGTQTFQGLFFSNGVYSNIRFENNLIYTANNRGISVSNGSNIEAHFNTVMRVAGSQKATFISLPSGSIKEHNIEANNTTKNEQRFVGTNIVTQWDDPTDVAHYSNYYVNAMQGPFATIEDFAPVKGSAADGKVGAFLRINQLLKISNGGQAASLVPTILLLIDSNNQN